MTRSLKIDRTYPVFGLAAVSVIVFLPHILGIGVFIGDSDRMNHSLSAFGAYLRGFSEGQAPLWNEAVFGGYSLVGLPFQYPNPIVFLASLLGVTDVYFFAGLEATTLLFFAGLFAYAFLRESDRSKTAAFVGGVLYQTCALSVLKVSQNDMSFLVIALIPLLLLFIRRSSESESIGNYIGLFLVTAALFNFAFLQKVAYAGILAGLYTIWLAGNRRSWKPIFFNLAAAIPALLIAAPRLITVGLDLAEGNRLARRPMSPGSVYEGTGFSPTEILRWFDERVFGATFEEASRLGNHLNLHEGFLLYLTSFAPFLLVYMLAGRIPWRRKDRDAQFFVFFTVLCFLFVFTAFGYWLLWWSFFRVDFIHFRILVVAVLPCCALLALTLDEFRERITETPGNLHEPPALRLVVRALCFVLAVELIAHYLNLRNIHLPAPRGRYLEGGACFRIAASFVALFVLWWTVHRKTAPKNLHLVLATFLAAQGTLYAALTVWGPGRWPMPPSYKTPTRLMARAHDFRIPSEMALRDVRGRLEADRYRTAFICPHKDVGIFCPTHIANFWRLRSIDGYVSTVPKRLSVLPLGHALSPRVLSFSSLGQVDWALMGLFNVQYALVFRPELFTNAVRKSGKPVRELAASDLTVHRNPLPVAPRVFFARTVVTKKDLRDALEDLFPQGRTNPGGYNPERRSVAEGLPSDRVFATDESPIARFAWDRVTVDVSQSAEERFLVLNERYDPNWIATSDSGRAVEIFPTNVFMRGVIVPAGTRQITFEYKPFMARPIALFFYLSGVVLAVITVIGIWMRRRLRSDKQRSLETA